MNHPKYGEISIRGITGWNEEPRCEVKSEHDTQCRKSAGHEEHDFPKPRLSPEEALAKIKKLAKEGKVQLATEMEPDRGGFTIQWDASNYGFGELAFWVDKDGKFHIDDECSSREFLIAVLTTLVESSVLTSEERERV